MKLPNDKKTRITVIILVVTVILSFSIYGLVTQINPTIQLNPFAKKTASTTIVTSDIKDFIPFTTADYQAHYPPNLKTNTRETEKKVTIDTWSPPASDYSIFITSREDVSNIKFFTTGDTVEPITVDGQQTTKTTGYTRVGTVIHIGPIPYKGKQFILIYDSGKNQATPESIEIFNAMVSTFTFDK